MFLFSVLLLHAPAEAISMGDGGHPAWRWRLVPRFGISQLDTPASPETSRKKKEGITHFSLSQPSHEGLRSVHWEMPCLISVFFGSGTRRATCSGYCGFVVKRRRLATDDVERENSQHTKSRMMVRCCCITLNPEHAWWAVWECCDTVRIRRDRDRLSKAAVGQPPRPLLPKEEDGLQSRPS